MKQPLVSIIIPTYNVEPYLVQCLESVEAQTYNNFECIIIVDGATDKSYEIAKDYCASHSKFKVYYQENAGSGPARNNGIHHASGEYLCFIDPDDWVETNYIESLLVEQQKLDYDLVISQTIDRNINSNDELVSSKKNIRPHILLKTQQECRDSFPLVVFIQHYLDGPICKLYKTSIVKENNIEFPDYRRSQDMVFNIRYYNYISRMSTISDYTYNIRCEYPPRQGRGRIFKGYNEIVAKIYYEVKHNTKSWNLDLDNSADFHTWSYWYLYGHICRSVLSGSPYDYICKEPYRTIIAHARPTLIQQKIIRYLLMLHLYPLVNLCVKIMNKLR